MEVGKQLRHTWELLHVNYSHVTVAPRNTSLVSRYFLEFWVHNGGNSLSLRGLKSWDFCIFPPRSLQSTSRWWTGVFNYFVHQGSCYVLLVLVHLCTVMSVMTQNYFFFKPIFDISCNVKFWAVSNLVLIFDWRSYQICHERLVDLCNNLHCSKFHF